MKRGAQCSYGTSVFSWVNHACCGCRIDVGMILINRCCFFHPGISWGYFFLVSPHVHAHLFSKYFQIYIFFQMVFRCFLIGIHFMLLHLRTIHGTPRCRGTVAENGCCRHFFSASSQAISCCWAPWLLFPSSGAPAPQTSHTVVTASLLWT